MNTQETFKLPEHLFVSETDGGLFDTRKPKWESTPIRQNYRRSFREITNTMQLRASLRVPYAWPGGYAIFYVTSDGGCLCHSCAVKEYRQISWAIRNRCNDGWRVLACEATCNVDTSDENPLVCDHCGKGIK